MIPIIEIFTSIDGEVNRWGQGVLSTFIRFAGCNLRCSYCDTPNSFSINNATEMTIQEIVHSVDKLGCQKVTTTGGEPLLDKNQFSLLLHALHRKGCRISVETNGTLMPLLQDLDLPEVDWIFDYKLRSSGMEAGGMSDWLFAALPPTKSRIKLIIRDQEDYDQAVFFVKWIRCHQKELTDRKFIPIHFSACMGLDGAISPSILAEWLIRDQLFDIGLNVQIHKLIDMK